MQSPLFLLIFVHVSAVVAKLVVFFAIPRLKNVLDVRAFLNRHRPYARIADLVLWLTGAGLLYYARWQMLTQTWMLVSIGLYLVVFVMIRFALVREMEKISASKKITAGEELKRLRTNNWCVGLLSVGLLGIIAYLMMNKP